MMTLALLFKVGPWLLGVAGIVFGLFRHQQAKTATAKLDTVTAQAQAQVSTEQAAEAQANTTAAQAGSAAAAARTAVDNAVAAQPAMEVQDELKNWTRD